MTRATYLRALPLLRSFSDLAVEPILDLLSDRL
jgi:hypothetical protein